jgi:hypothetical protein
MGQFELLISLELQAFIQMTMKQPIIAILLLLSVLSAIPLQGQQLPPTNPDDSQRMFALARDLWAPLELQVLNYVDSQIDPNTAELMLRQACIFLQTTVQLDYKNDIAWHDLMFLLTTDTINDPGRATQAVIQYSSLRPKDERPIDVWLRYRLNLLNDLETREYFLDQNISALQDYPAVKSQILTRLGKMAWEKGIIDNIPPAMGKSEIIGARSRFIEAANVDINNTDAIAALLELPPPALAEISSLQFMPEKQQARLQAQQRAIKFQQELYSALLWRLRLRHNPYDLQRLLLLIETLDRIACHELAQEYYDYAYKLLDLTDELEDFTHELRFKQLVSAYSGKLYSNCLDIAQQALKNKPNDLLISGLQAKAMLELGMKTKAQNIMLQAAESAREKLSTAQNPDPQLQSELAWFYCFIDPDPVLALQYAQTAHQALPDDARTADIFAYAQTMNEQFETAQALLETTNSEDPIAALAWAKILLAQNNNSAARQKLEKIEPAQSGILTEEIQQILSEISADSPDSKTTPEIPTTADTETAVTETKTVASPPKNSERITASLRAEFNGNDLLIIDAPEKVVRCSLWLSKDIFQYGDPILAQLYLSNISDSDKQDTLLALGPDSWIDPHVLITAEVDPPDSGFSSGILSHRYLIQNTLLSAGKSNSLTESLTIGPLGHILNNHPQQEYRITFRAILDPVPDGKGGFTGKIPAIQPPPVTITRKAFSPTPQRLNAYLNTLTTGEVNERIRATQLMAGLLREYQLARRQRLNYNVRSIDERAIREIISRNLSHTDNRVRAWSAYALHSLPLAADSPEGQKLAELLNDYAWFVRFMAINTLQPIADLTEYFNWVHVLEKDPLILRQIQLLQRQPWEVVDMPVEIPEPTDQTPPPKKPKPSGPRGL